MLRGDGQSRAYAAPPRQLSHMRGEARLPMIAGGAPQTGLDAIGRSLYGPMPSGVIANAGECTAHARPRSAPSDAYSEPSGRTGAFPQGPSRAPTDSRYASRLASSGPWPLSSLMPVFCAVFDRVVLKEPTIAQNFKRLRLNQPIVV